MKSTAKPTVGAPPPTLRATTSASNIPRRKLCPGSAREEAKYGQIDNEFSEEGVLLHSLFMRWGEDRDDCPIRLARKALDPDRIHALTFAETLAMEFMRDFMLQHGIDEKDELRRLHEQDMVFNGKEGPLFPGHADIIVTWPRHSARVVIDAKFGFLEVDHAAENEQLASYAVQAQQRDPVSVCGVCIVQPRNFGPKSSRAVYSKDGMKAAEKEITRIFRESEKPDAPLVAGTVQCHFCRAKAACPAAQKAIVVLHETKPLAVETLTLPQLVEVAKAISFANKIKDEVGARMRREITDGKLPDWKLQNTGSVRKEKDGVGLYHAFCDQLAKFEGFTAAAYDDCREISWGKLEALVQKVTGTSKAAAERLVKEVAAPFITEEKKTERCVEVRK